MNDACRELYDYWNRMRGRARAPRRSEIDPADIRHILGDIFILEPAADGGDFRFRLAGTRLCGAYCAELKDRGFLAFWPWDDAAALREVIASVLADAQPAAATMIGTNERGQELEFEIVLLPLRRSARNCDRVLGALAPAERPYWLGIQPIMRQRLVSLRLIAPMGRDTGRDPFARREKPPAAGMRPPPAAPAGPPAGGRAGRGPFIVYDGGKP